MAIAAGVVGRALEAASVALKKVSAERGRMAARQCEQDGVLRRRQLDHCFVSSELKPRVRSVHAANGEVASDHHPLWIDIDLESAA